MVQSRPLRAVSIPPPMLLPEIFQWLRLRRVLCQLSIPLPNVLAYSIPRGDRCPSICTPGQIPQTLSVFPASAQSSLTQRHQCAHGQHQRIAFRFCGRLVDESADACVLVIVQKVSGQLSVSVIAKSW